MLNKESYINRIIITISTKLPTRERLLGFIELHCEHVLPAIHKYSTFEEIVLILIEYISIPELELILSNINLPNKHGQFVVAPEEGPQKVPTAQYGSVQIGVGGSSKRTIRDLIQEIFITDVDFVAFCVDYFPEVARRFGSGMSLPEKETLLIMHADRSRLLTILERLSPGSRTKADS